MSQSLRILILNNVCGPLTAMANSLEQLDHTVSYIEADPSVTLDLEQTKTAIESFKPDFVLQQNFNVYMLTGEFGKQLLAWIESNGFKQLFWFLTRPECINQIHLYREWLELGYFKTARFACASKSMMPFFSQSGLAADYLPIAVSDKMVPGLPNQDDKAVISYFSNTVTSHSDSPTEMVLATLSAKEQALRYFMMVITSQFSGFDPQMIIGHIIGPVRTFFTTTDINFDSHQQKRQSLAEALKHLPVALVDAVLHQVEFIYTDHVSCGIYQHIQQQVEHCGGSPFWDAMDNNESKVGPAAACQLDAPMFHPGLVVTFSPFLTMQAPSSAPLSVIAGGSLCLSEHKSELSELVPGEYLLNYKNLDELKTHVDQYAKDKPTLTDQRIAAQQYVTTHHDYNTRAQQLVTLIADLR